MGGGDDDDGDGDNQVESKGKRKSNSYPSAIAAPLRNASALSPYIHTSTMVANHVQIVITLLSSQCFLASEGMNVLLASSPKSDNTWARTILPSCLVHTVTLLSGIPPQYKN